MKIKARYFLLYANCIIVKGASRSTICDLQKGFYVFIPNTFADILTNLEKISIDIFIEENPNIDINILTKHFDYLIKNDLGHFCSNKINFPKINTSFKMPNEIEDCIIELSNFTYNNMTYIIKSLKKLGCNSLELRAYNQFPLKKISEIMKLLQDSKIRNVELYLKYDSKISLDNYESFISSNQIIGQLVVHSCNSDISYIASPIIYFTNQKIISSNCCGKISKEDFIVNLPFYLEGLKHNTCLSRKVSITKDGYIKNCPSIRKNYGNVINNSIESTISKPEFQELWNISKDEIKVCKDCEFRYICSDCRAHVEDNYSKPKNCKYDPYTMNYLG